MFPFLRRQYSNGADNNVSSTALDTGATLGNGGNASPLSTRAIIGVVVGVVVVILGCLVAYYMRKLELRRKVDIRNKERAAAMNDNIPDPILGKPGDPIPLQDLYHHPRLSAQSAQTSEKMDGCDKVLSTLPGPAKLPLWHYIHWKDPLDTQVIKAKPRGQPDTEHLEPNSFYD